MRPSVMMMPSGLAASDELRLVPAPQLATPLWICCAVALALAAVCIALAFMPRRADARRRPAGAHADGSDKRAWLARIDAVVHDYDARRITADDAYARLAAIARAFASARSGRPLATRTLRDLEREPRGGDAGNWDALRMTIAALYPPEFADADHPRVREASVATAAGWVSDLVERWR